MEPLSALGAAAAVVQFVDYGSRLLSNVMDIYHSQDEATKEQVALKKDIRRVEDLAVELLAEFAPNSLGNSSTRPERAIADLALDCDRYSKELLSLLRELQAGELTGNPPRRSKWQSLRKAVQGLGAQGQIDSLVLRLDRVRSELTLQMLVLTRNEQQQSSTDLKQLVVHMNGSEQQAKSMQAKLTRHMNESEQRQQWLQELFTATQSANREALQETTQHPTYLCIPSESTAAEPQVQMFYRQMKERFLHNLKFRQSHDRYERVSAAHSKTFEWIFDTGGTQRHDWVDFTEWLEGTSSTYWITGKPGSGKSTLMKYIHNDPRTLNHLSRWAGSYDVKIVSFFFWNSGTAMQMSQEGLARSLLHDVLYEHRDMISECFPERWQTWSLFGVNIYPFTETELAIALRVLFSSTFTDAIKTKYLLHVDGLDECEGDCEWLLKLFHDLSRNTSNLKCCLASRPWPVFEEAYGAKPKLLLEKLTHSDIRSYVTDNLLENTHFREFTADDPDGANGLFNEILEKAAGVFLWVVLVVRSLREGLRDGDSIDDLRKRLYELPDDLEDLFQKILNSIQARHRADASRFFQIVEMRHHYGLHDAQPTVVEVSLADENQPDFAVNYLPPDESQRDLWLSRAKVMIRRLKSRCKGLLEVHIDSAESSTSASVEFLHRTVRDYIKRQDVWSDLVAFEPRMLDASVALFGAELVNLKTKPVATVEECMRHAKLALGLASIAEERSPGKLAAALEQFDSVMTSYYNNPIIANSAPASSRLWSANAEHWMGRMSAHAGLRFLHGAIAFGLVSFVRSQLTLDHHLPSYLQRSFLISPLDLAIDSSSLQFDNMDGVFNWSSRRDMVELLLTSGCDPNWGYMGHDRMETPFARFAELASKVPPDVDDGTAREDV